MAHDVDQDPPQRHTPILYQNRHRTVTLLDLPLSIELAQGASDNAVAGGPSARRLATCPAPQFPYPSLEPRTEAARRKVLTHRTPLPEEERYAELIFRGLAEIREQWHEEWCLPRSSVATTAPPRKRKRCPEGDGGDAVNAEGPMESASPDLSFEAKHRRVARWVLATTSSANTASCTESIAQRLVANQTDHPASLRIRTLDTAFHIPSGASFYLDRIDARSARRWSDAMRAHLAMPTCTAGPGQFDLVVADPPWNNRSAKRAGAYATSRAQRSCDPWPAVVTVLGEHLAPQAVVACWVTNSVAARDEALRAFAVWDVSLIGEWVWVKTTVHGEPVTAVEGLWRKPYEVLLVGRRRATDEEDGTHNPDGNTMVEPDHDSVAEEQPQPVLRRLVVAVPDLHSRKPCLRALLEPLLPRHAESRAVEIFARCLSRGWSAWGEEVLRFSWEGSWQDVEVRPGSIDAVGPETRNGASGTKHEDHPFFPGPVNQSEKPSF